LFNYRRPVGQKLRTNTSLLVRNRKEVNTVRKLVKITPKETLTYAQTRKFKWYMEASIDFEDNTAPGVGGVATTAHNQDYSIYAGYIWDF